MKDQKKKDQGRQIVMQATAILVAVALILVILGYTFLKFYRGYSMTDLISDVVGNLLGVLAAFLLFDILYNKLTQDAYAKETSQQITKTLMGDPSTLDAFTEEDKEAFLKSTVQSIMKDDDAAEMVVGNMKKYISRARVNRIRKSFNYTITLTCEQPAECAVLPGTEEYYYVQENLNYEVKYLADKDRNFGSREIKIGFSFDKHSLDAGLLESDRDSEFARCIFNESLDVTREAIAWFRSLNAQDLRVYFEKIFTPTVKIDRAYGELKTVDMRDGGIVATYDIDFDTTAMEHAVRVIFHMPKRWGTIFEVVLVDPTREPKITFDYVPGKMDVTMYSYLNKEDESNEGAYEERNGIYDVAIRNEWIYPKSGIVFTVNRKE